MNNTVFFLGKFMFLKLLILFSQDLRTAPDPERDDEPDRQARRAGILQVSGGQTPSYGHRWAKTDIDGQNMYIYGKAKTFILT